MKQNINGILLLDKPLGLSSNKALQHVKQLYRAKKAGHTGSLDPLASGMLPLCFGEATKISAFLLDADKTYVTTARLGISTTTADTEGELLEKKPIPTLNREYLEAVLENFIGEIDQIPPMYSALKHKGQRLYELARAGKTVERPARKITIYTLKLLEFTPKTFTLEVNCSKGTYIRSLIEDIAKALGSCAHVSALRRTAVNPFQHKMYSLEDLSQWAKTQPEKLEACLLPVDTGLTLWPRLALNETQAIDLSHGRKVALNDEQNVSFQDSKDKLLRLYQPNGILLGLGEMTAAHDLRIKRLFHL